MFCDATFLSPLHADGSPHPGAADTDGVVLARADNDKRTRIYREVEDCSSVELVVLGCELGGRWNQAAISLVTELARHKVQTAPPMLRASAQQAWANRWWAKLGVATRGSAHWSELRAMDGGQGGLLHRVIPFPALQLLIGRPWLLAAPWASRKLD